MDKNKFLDLNIDDKIDYLNKKLEEGKTVIRIREDIGIGEKALQKIIKEAGYKYSPKDKMYCKNSVYVPQNNQKNEVLEKNNEYKYDINILQTYKNDLIELIKSKDDILNIVKEYREKEYYKDNTNIIEVVSPQGIKIKEFKTKARATSVRVYDETLEKWKEFCNENKMYSNQNLLSMALEEYMEKYSK